MNKPKAKKTHQSNTLPETGYIRLKQILIFIPFSAATIWRKVKAGTFPKPIKLSENITAWKAEEVREWLDNVGAEVEA